MRMKQWTVGALVVVASATALLGAGAAFAQSGPDEGPGSADKGKSVQAVTVYDKWDDDLVAGDLVRPDGELVGGHVVKKNAGILIKLRRSFSVEVTKSVEKL